MEREKEHSVGGGGPNDGGGVCVLITAGIGRRRGPRDAPWAIK